MWIWISWICMVGGLVVGVWLGKRERDALQAEVNKLEKEGEAGWNPNIIQAYVTKNREPESWPELYYLVTCENDFNQCYIAYKALDLVFREIEKRRIPFACCGAKEPKP